MDSTKADQFFATWMRYLNTKKHNNTAALSTEKYQEQMHLVKTAKWNCEAKSFVQFNLLKRLDAIGNVENH